MDSGSLSVSSLTVGDISFTSLFDKDVDHILYLLWYTTLTIIDNLNFLFMDVRIRIFAVSQNNVTDE